MLQHITRRRALYGAIVSILILAVPSALAGEVQLSWDSSEGATGYHLYRGTSPGNYGAPLDVGNTTQTAVEDLDDCTLWYFAVTASNVSGESDHSTVETTWPRAVMQSASPATVEQGHQASIVVNGVNFRDGDVVTLSNPGITLDGVTLNSCQQMVLSMTVAGGAPTGPTHVTVVHPSGVAGTGSALFTVNPPTPPTVVATSPLDGTNDVPLTVLPSVQFSEPVGGVTSSTVRLLDGTGSAVVQAAGSPALSPDGTVATITPAAELELASVYRIQVLAGATGIQDLDGNPLAEEYLQATGFTTIGDQSAPQVTELQATEIDGTSAVISWTTNEPASSSVSYRKQGDELYVTLATATETTAHSIQLGGLEPETTYEFHVSSTDDAGNTTTTDDDLFTTTSSPYHYLRFETEGGVLSAPVATAQGADAFGGAWIQTPNGGGTGTPTDPNGSALHGVNLPTADVWYLWVRMLGGGSTSNSWFESIDGSERQIVSTTTYDQWVWVAGSAYDLDAGLHAVELAGREGGARADRLLLTNDPQFVPTEQPDVDLAPPGPVASFEAVAGQGSIELSWTNPGAGDLASVVIRYRTDGQYPTNPLDGFAVVETPATPGAADSHSHNEIEPGVSYYYSAFALDSSGNLSVAAHALGAIVGAPPPPQNVQAF